MSAGTRSLTLPWSRTYGAFVWPERRDVVRHVYVLADRPTPRPPWLALSPASLPDGLRTEPFLAAIQARVGAAGYRSLEGAPGRRTAAALLDAVRSRQRVPGALEVAPPTPPATVLARVAPAGAVMAGLVGLLGAAPVGALLAGALGAGGGWLATELVRRRDPERPRVLVLAPDGCVLGLPDGPAPLAWPDVASVYVTGAGELSIARRADGRVLTMPASAFTLPTGLLAAVAETYRRRGAA